MPLTVVELDEGLEDKFLGYIMKDPLAYYFFIADWQRERDNSRFLLALEGGRIIGVMLIFKGRIIQPRGSARAVKALIEHIDIDDIEGMVQLEHRDLLLGAFRPERQAEMHMLHMRKGQERLAEGRVSKRLGAQDARAVAALMRSADPRMWGKQTAEMVRRSMKTGTWVGVRDGGKLAAIGMARTMDIGGMIHTIATAEAYRNRGYATANVSILVRKIFKGTGDALIHVMKDNGPAYYVYTRVGFRPYRKFFYIKGGKRRERALGTKKR
jgi:ribosomal-protein-alanine N-acetyltransferase